MLFTTVKIVRVLPVLSKISWIGIFCCEVPYGNKKSLGDIFAADPLQLIRQGKIGVQNPSVEEKKECLYCPWRYWCSGGCPLVAYNSTGQYDSKSPNCKIYKTLYPEALRLEGLRLLKYRFFS
jgi:uncharacterized protein